MAKAQGDPGRPLTSGLTPMHPGELLKDVIFPALDRPMEEIAGYLGMSRMNLYRLMRGDIPVTAELAVKLAQLLGGADAEYWLRLQGAYDLAVARRTIGDSVKAIPTLKAAEAA